MNIPRDDAFARFGRLLLHEPLLQLQILLAVAVVFGGGGVGFGLLNLVVQLVALIVLAFNGRRLKAFWTTASWPLRILMALTIALPTIQLIPLPPAIWAALPGRDLVQQSFAAAGLPADSWFPISVDSGRTLVSLTGLIVPFTMVSIGCTLESWQKRKLVESFCWIALAALVFGAFELATFYRLGLMFGSETNTGVLSATFANRNSTGLFFDIALVMVTGLLPHRSRQSVNVRWIIFASVFALGVILTRSRSSIVILALALLFICARFALWHLRGKSEPHDSLNRPMIGAGIFVMLIVSAAAASFIFGGTVRQSFDRFGTITSTQRPAIWKDAAHTARRYFPVGSGMGTFDEVFQIDESLEYLSPRTAGRAHNDYLEVTIEAGVAGLALAFAWLIWCSWTALLPAGQLRNSLRVGALFSIYFIAIQSLLDYPLRNQSMLCILGLLIAMLARPIPGRDQ